MYQLNKKMITILETPCNSIEESSRFYTELGFTTVDKDKNSETISDGKIIIRINSDIYTRPGIKLISTDWTNTIINLKKITKVVKADNGHILSDPSGIIIRLEQTNSMPQYNLPTESSSELGNCAGISLECLNTDLAIQIWETIGFKMVTGSPENGFVILANDNGDGISIMQYGACPHMFFNPSVTYFNGKNNIDIINNIRDKKITITEEITHFNKQNIADNIIIRDPGGIGFFIFND